MLGHMHSNQYFGENYPKRPCHLKVCTRQLTLRVDEQLLSSGRQSAVQLQQQPVARPECTAALLQPVWAALMEACLECLAWALVWWQAVLLR